MFSTAANAVVLASFANMVSRSDNGSRYGHSFRPSGLLFPHIHSRQATLHAATRFCALPCRFISWFVRDQGLHGRFLPSSHNTKSPRKTGRMPHAIGARPESLTPSIHPKLGVKSRHQGLHRCALQRIFRPFLENGIAD